MKNKQQLISDQYIVLHWWNMGQKTVDFKGTVSEYFKLKGFKVRNITHPTQKDINGLRFKFELSSRVITLDIFHYKFQDAAIEAIQLFLTVLGDRATITTHGRTIRVN